MITVAPALAALIERYIGYPASLQNAARHPVQVQWARAFGATAVVDPSALTRAVRRATGSMAI